MDEIVELYRQLRRDGRLQQDWERNQPRRDRALESVLIARCSREVATAALLSIKLRFEPAAGEPALLRPEFPSDLLEWGKGQGAGASRLVGLVARQEIPDVVRAASLHALLYYHDRSGPGRVPASRSG